MKIKQTTKSFTNSKGDAWEWTETPEVTEALKKLHRPLDTRKVSEEDTLKNYTLGGK